MDQATQETRWRQAEWMLRWAMFGTFFGHGVLAVMMKGKFVDMFIGMAKLVGWAVSGPVAARWIFWIGVLDILVAIAVLWRPLRAILVWGALWALLTALARPMAAHGWNILSPAVWVNPNTDNMWDLIERAANFGIPLALLWIRGLPKTAKEWFA